MQVFLFSKWVVRYVVWHRTIVLCGTRRSCCVAHDKIFILKNMSWNLSCAHEKIFIWKTMSWNLSCAHDKIFIWKNMSWNSQQVEVLLSFVRGYKKLLHQNRVFWRIRWHYVEVWRELKGKFPEVLKGTHCWFLEPWNREKSLTLIWQHFSCLLDEWIAKISKKKNHGGFSR